MREGERDWLVLWCVFAVICVWLPGDGDGWALWGLCVGFAPRVIRWVQGGG